MASIRMGSGEIGTGRETGSAETGNARGAGSGFAREPRFCCTTGAIARRAKITPYRLRPAYSASGVDRDRSEASEGRLTLPTMQARLLPPPGSVKLCVVIEMQS